VAKVPLLERILDVTQNHLEPEVQKLLLELSQLRHGFGP